MNKKIKAYYIKATCPMFSKDYIKVYPYIYVDEMVAKQSLEDYRWIDAERVMCEEFELIEFEIEECKINKKYRVDSLKDYEGDKKFDIHGFRFLEMIGRI